MFVSVAASCLNEIHLLLKSAAAPYLKSARGGLKNPANGRGGVPIIYEKALFSILIHMKASKSRNEAKRHCAVTAEKAEAVSPTRRREISTSRYAEKKMK